MKPFENLSAFMEYLEARGLLKRIAAPVSTVLEMTEIHRRVLEAGGPALLFEKPVSADGKIHKVPVLVNLFGTVERVALALGRKPEELGELGNLLASLRQPEPPAGLSGMVESLPMLKSVLSMKPKTTRAPASVQEVVFTGSRVNLNMLPAQSFWPGEPAPLITWGMAVTQGTGGVNLGVYRMQVLGRNRAIMRWLPHRGGAQHLKQWVEANGNKPMPVAVVIGADSATMLAAVTPIPDTLSEYDFAGLLRGKRLELAPCKTIPLSVPAHAEIVLEGHVLPDVLASEGPYGDHTGYLNSVESFPVFEVSAITMRKNPVYVSTYLGRPPDEASTMSRALNDVFLPLMRQQFSEVVDFWLPPEACSYRMAVVSIRKTYPGQARRIMMGVWSWLRQFTYTKMVIVVDEDINVRSWPDVIWALSTRMDPARDTLILDNTPIDYLDFASPKSGLGGKMGLDATTKIGLETERTWGRVLEMDEKIKASVSRRLKELGLEKFKAK